jgi:hypothetical protein
MRFSLIFGEEIGGFFKIKNQCYDQIFANTSRGLRKNAIIFAKIFGENTFKNKTSGPTVLYFGLLIPAPFLQWCLGPGIKIKGHVYLSGSLHHIMGQSIGSKNLKGVECGKANERLGQA